MKVIGLTGSVGMGKSITAALLRRLRIPVHDADATVHRLLSPGGAAFTLVARLFPEAWDKKKYLIDRRRLGDIVFKDASDRQRLEAVLHPLVWREQKKFIQKARRCGIKRVVLDIPLLYETGAEKKCDYVMTVTAPTFLQRQRVLRRPGMNEDRLRALLALQVTDLEKRHRARWTVQTGLGRGFTLRALRRILGEGAHE